MDIHTSFDEFLDLRDQNEEGGLLQQQGEPYKSQSGQQLQQQQQLGNSTTPMTNGENTSTTAAVTTSTPLAQDNEAVATVPTWNMAGSDGSLVPGHTSITHGTNNNNNDNIVNAATGSTTSAAAATLGDPNQPFYFPLDSASWASVFAASDMNTAALTAFMNDNQQEAAAAAAGTVVPLASADVSTASASVSQHQHYIPPQQMLLQQPPSFIASTSATASSVPTSTAAATTTTDSSTMNNNKTDIDKSVENVELPEVNQQQQEEEGMGKMKTRSSMRLRTTVSNKLGSEEPNNNASPTTTTTETPKKKTKGKKLYCICQQPYTGEPMVQCDKCTEWFHCACVDLDADEAEDVETWVCKNCEAEQDKSVTEEDAPNGEQQQSSTPAKDQQSTTTITTERPYATRQARAKKCLLPTCKNRTRADSYCSDVCATQDSMRKSGDNEYVPTKSASPPKERRTRTASTASSSSSLSSSTSTDNKKPTLKQQKSSPSKQSQQQQTQEAPETDPIRKSVVKNMSTILKTIIESASDKDPSLFAASEQVTSTASSPSSATASTNATTTASGAVDCGADQQQSEQQQQQQPSPQVMADQLASAIEETMFKELKDPTTKRAGVQYKNKFRSLLYNLKDKANEGFQLRVVTGELTPMELIRMSSEDMANPELRSMSLSMRQESIKNSIMKRANVPIIKKTHKGDIIMIGTPDKEEMNSSGSSNQQQQQRHHYHGHERPRWINTASSSDGLGGGDDSGSRKSSYSETPTTPVAVSRDQREDDQRFEDILSKIGIGSRDDGGDAGGSSKRGSSSSNSPFDGVDRPKKRKVEIDMEKLLGEEDDYQPEFGDDDMEEGEGSTTPPYPPPASPPAVPRGPPKPPTIWHGRVNMPQVSEFEASARQVGGRILSEAEWAEVLSPTMWIEGRIPVDRVTQYVTQTQYATSREIVLLEIEATTATTAGSDKNYQNAQTLIKYFDSRKRFGVVGHNKTKVKDFYLIPLYKTQQLPDCLYVVRVEETQRDVDMFLGVLVIQKPQERPLPPPPVPQPMVSQQQQQPAERPQYYYQQPQQQQRYQVPTYPFPPQQQQVPQVPQYPPTMYYQPPRAP